jgi:hypothetical protein
MEHKHLMEIESAHVIQLGWRTFQKRRAMSTMRRLAQVEAAAATRIESSWKRIIHQSKYRLAVASTYRKLYARSHLNTSFLPHLFLYPLFLDIVVGQSLVRRFLASRRAAATRQEKCAITIQKRWRGFLAFEKYIQTIFYLLVLQSTARRLLACRRVSELKEKKFHLETTSATMIASAWRTFMSRRQYLLSVSGKFP